MSTTYTTNYHLGKQTDTSDNFDMSVITDNMDIIDTQMSQEEYKSGCISEQTLNLWPYISEEFKNFKDYPISLPVGTYTVTVDSIVTESTKTSIRMEFYDANDTRISVTEEEIVTPASTNYLVFKKTGRSLIPAAGSFRVFTTSTAVSKVRIYSADTASNSVGYKATWKDIQIQVGYVTNVVYVPPFTAKDSVARNHITTTGDTIVCFGDSIIGNFTAPTDIPSYISKYVNANCINVGFGGTRMVDNSDYGARGYFSMCKLAEAVASGNFSAQDAALLEIEDTDHLYSNNLTKLKAIDFSKVDIVTMEQCTNDWYGDVTLSADNDSHLVYTNALRYVLDTLLTAYPNLRIVLISPIYRWFSASSDSNNYTNSNGNTLPDFASAMHTIADEFNLQFIDDYHIGLCKYNRSIYLSDGTHPTEEGRILIAKNIAHNLY